MDARKRRALFITVAVLSLMVLAAPARGADWFGVRVGTGGLSVSFGSTDWAVYGSSWSNPGWSVDYHVALSGYGEWVWVDGLGQCWRPWVTTGWRPYTHGRWVWTSYGWTWVSYEPWGFFPHHYGHWAMSPYGWVWAPGYVYRPARVTWVSAGGYIGWYPSPPPGWSHCSRGFVTGYDHGYRNGYDAGYWSGWNDARYATYSRWQDLGSNDVSRHAIPASAVRASAPNTRPRIGSPPPDRSSLTSRGVDIPERLVDQRTVTVDSRQVTVVRPRGVERAVRDNGQRTVERALATKARTTAIQRTNDRSSAAEAVDRRSDRALGDRSSRVHNQPSRSSGAATRVRESNDQSNRSTRGRSGRVDSNTSSGASFGTADSTRSSARSPAQAIARDSQRTTPSSARSTQSRRSKQPQFSSSPTNAQASRPATALQRSRSKEASSRRSRSSSQASSRTRPEQTTTGRSNGSPRTSEKTLKTKRRRD